MSKTFSPKITVKIVSGDYVMGGATGYPMLLTTDHTPLESQRLRTILAAIARGNAVKFCGVADPSIPCDKWLRVADRPIVPAVKSLLRRWLASGCLRVEYVRRFDGLTLCGRLSISDSECVYVSM